MKSDQVQNSWTLGLISGSVFSSRPRFVLKAQRFLCVDLLLWRAFCAVKYAAATELLTAHLTSGLSSHSTLKVFVFGGDIDAACMASKLLLC